MDDGGGGGGDWVGAESMLWVQARADLLLSVLITFGWLLYNLRFIWRVAEYNRRVDAVLTAEVNPKAEYDLQVVPATKVVMGGDDDSNTAAAAVAAAAAASRRGDGSFGAFVDNG